MEQTILMRLLEIVIYSAAVFLFVWLFRSVFSKLLSPTLKYALWFLVVLRLCIPVTFESGLHLISLPAASVQSTQAATPAETITQETNPQAALPQLDGGATLPQPQTEETLAGTPETKTAPLNWQQWLLILWAAGFAVALSANIVFMLQLRGRVRQLGCEPGEKIAARYQELKQQMQIRGSVPLVLMPDIKSPALTVEPRPRLLMPDRLIYAANAESMAFAMAHELMHYKRRDYLVCLLLLLLRAVYWFHPVAWALLHLMRLDMETACDAMVVSRFDKDRKLSYVNLLLALGEDTAPISFQQKVG